MHLPVSTAPALPGIRERYVGREWPAGAMMIRAGMELIVEMILMECMAASVH